MDKYSKSSAISGGIMWQSVALGAGIGIVTTIILMFIAAVILASVDMSASAPAVVSTLCLGLGALLGGFISAKRNGRNGMIVGIATGGALFLVFALVALALGSKIGMMFVIRLIVSCVLAAFGGIAGINIRPKRKYV